MSQTILLKKLTNIINPFKEDMFGIGSPLDENEISKALGELNFEILKTDSPKEVLNKKIAFLMKNEKEIPIGINVGFPESGQDPKEIIIENKLGYVIAILKKKKEIEVEIEGSTELAKLLLSLKKIEVSSNIDKTNAHYSELDLIDLAYRKPNEEETWTNKEFCLKKLDESFRLNAKLIDKKLWEDEDFVEQAFKIEAGSKNSLFSLSEDLLISTLIVKQVCKNPSLFTDAWNNIYKDIFDKEVEIKKHEFKYNDSKYANEIQLKLKELKEEYHENANNVLYQEIEDLEYSLEEIINESEPRMPSSEKELITLLKENYLNKEEWVLLFAPIKKISFIYNYISADLQENTSILKSMINNEISKDYYHSSMSFDKIPLSFLTTPENAAFYLEKKISITNSLSNMEPQIAVITKDKDYLIDTINRLPEKIDLEAIWQGKWTNKKLSTDKDVIDAFLKKDANIYRFLPNTFTTKMEYILNYIENGKDMEYISKSILNEITDEETILKILHKSPKLLGDENRCPVAWRKNKKYLPLLGQSLNYLHYSSAAWKKIIGNDVNGYIPFIQSCASVFNCFPKDVQENETLALVYAKQYRYENNSRDKMAPINSSLLASRHFCIELLKIDTGYAKRIPKVFFSDKQFLKELTMNIDTKEIANNVLEHNLSLKAFFQAFNIHENYSAFFMNHLLKAELKTDNTTTIKKRKI